MKYTFMNNNELSVVRLELLQLKVLMNDVSGLWNGKESGLEEKCAECAREVMKKAEELRELLDEMMDY